MLWLPLAIEHLAFEHLTFAGEARAKLSALRSSFSGDGNE
jgi:hypothetical protein